MAWAVLQVIAYASLAAFATWVSWRTPLATVGATLLFCCALTTAGYLTNDFGTAVLIESIEATVLCNQARTAFLTGGDWPAIAVVGLTLVDLAWCAIQPLQPPVGHSRAYWFAAGTNAIFIAMCLCTSYPGLRDVALDRRRRRRDNGVASDHGSLRDAVAKAVGRR